MSIERRLANWQCGQLKFRQGDLFVSTVRAFDTGGWETAVAHHDYNAGSLVIVETYGGDMEAARRGHEKWISAMTTEPLPDPLPERGDSMIGMLANAIDGRTGYPRERRPA